VGISGGDCSRKSPEIWSHPQRRHAETTAARSESARIGAAPRVILGLPATPMAGRTSTLALLMLAVPLLGACGRIDRARDCKKVATLLNPGLAAIDEVRQKNPGSADAYRDIARRYDALAASLWGVKVETRRLVDALVEYQKVMREASHDARVFADALDSRDPGKQNNARAAASRTVKHEGAVLGRIDGVCRSR
jgi:hypothetical protein